MTIDIDAIRKEWLRQCGLCDAGLLTECTCPKGDVRALISTLCDRVDELTAEREHMELNPTGTAEWLKNRVNELTAELEKVQAERGEFRDSALMYAAAVSERNNQITNVRRLCDEYKDQPPPIFQGPGLSERGEGYNAGTRDMARAVLDSLTEAVTP